MPSPAAAMAWEFRRRHRWGFLALAVYGVVLACMRGIHFDSEDSFALAVIVPLSAAFIYLLAIFTFGLSGDVAARQSIYPARMFTLPVTTASLAAWPMLYGSLAIAILWFATRLLVVWPGNAAVPVVWPALLAASLLGWTQALTWMPYPLPGLRVIVTVLWLATIDTIVMVALNLKAPEPVMLAILVPQLPLAYAVAKFAVGRARHGDAATVPPRPAKRGEGPRSGGEGLRSPASAQSWLEWRQHGRSLPALVALVLPFELALLFLFRSYPNIVVEIVIAVLFTPPFMAIFVAATVSSALTSFLATRPVSDAALVAAKLRAAMRSTLATWLLVIAAIPVGAGLSGTLPILTGKARELAEILGTPRAIALPIVAVAVLAGATWKQLVQSLYIGMTGRVWLVRASAFAALAFLTVAVALGQWVLSDYDALALAWNALPWIAAALVCLKLGIAGWNARRLRERGLVSDRTLLAGAALWDVVVLALAGALMWILPAMLVRAWAIALVAILVVPLARLSAAPLALAWNRHR